MAAALALILLIGLLSAPRAHAVPIVTYKCTPAPQDCSGWYRSNVSIDWTVLPSDAVVIGCQDKTYTADTSAGHAQRLEPGRYRWIVFPGYGPRARVHYGNPIGRSTFVMRR